MALTSRSISDALAALTGPVVRVEPREASALAWSFAFFFSVLCCYYIVRPLREEMGVVAGRDTLEWLFSVVFLVMVVAVPLFGWVVTTVAKRRIVPIVYAFLILDLVVFWLLFSAGMPGKPLAAAFFVWVSVFNLFAVSLFWSVMADCWKAEQAKRLYGVIAAGGSIGALCGPLITQSLVHRLGPTNLLLVAAFLLAGAIGCAEGLRAAVRGNEPDGAARSHEFDQGGIFAGARNVWQSPYLFQIALWVLIANTVSTYFYLEQASIVGQAYANPADRVQLFARMDLAVSCLTIAAQVLLTGKVMSRLGVALPVSALPVTATLGLIALAIAPLVGVVVVVMVIERAVTFAFSNPALRVLFTVVPPEDKYKSQNFIDTVVFRGGDAASGWLFRALGSDVLGLGMSAIAIATVPLALAWTGLSFRLGAMQASQSVDRATS